MEQLRLFLEGRDVGLARPEAAEQGSAVRGVSLPWARVRQELGARRLPGSLPQQPC